MDVRKFVKSLIPSNIFHKIEPYGHLIEAVLLNTVNGYPARGIKVIGVTGTNGKTTTSFLIHRMLHEAGYKVGLMTTVAYGVGDDIKPQLNHMTNVPMPELMRRLKYMRAQGVEWLVLETTSQALAQNRVWGVSYSIAVMTNVTHEHLDFHKTFEHYRDAKVKLFGLANKNKSGLKIGVINADDPSAVYFSSAITNPITYGLKSGDVVAREVELSANGVKYEVEVGGETHRIDCHIPGSFNVYNSLAAVCTGRAVGLNRQQIEQGIAALEGVEGRMTRITNDRGIDIIVDFAHTPDSFEKLFKDLKPVTKGKLIVLFGSPGRRDEVKRAIQGKLAGQYADEVILTEEDDRDVDGLEIMEQIAKGAEKMDKIRGTDLFLIHDRSKAIKFAIDRAKTGDTILLLGKGHEKTIERADGEHPWDEIAAAYSALKHQ